ncbi:MAG: PAS domain S-box protein [Bacteroidota bacterium]
MSAFKKHKKSYAILLVNLLLLIIGIVLYRETEQVLKANNEERLLTKTNLHIDSVLISLKDAQRGERGYVISGNKAYLKAFYNARKRLSGLVGDLETALNTQKDIQKRFVTSERWMANALSKFDEIIKTREEEGAVLETLAKKDYEGKLFIDTLQNTIQAIEKYEKEKLDNNAQKAIASLEEIVTLLALSGVVIFVIVILLSTSLVRDILKREELTLKLEGSEKRYHFLFELSADGIIITDLNEIITDCNNAACKIFGYTKHELIGQSYHLLFPEEQRQHLSRKVGRGTVTGDKLIEGIYLRKDGTQIHAEVYTKLIEINGLSNVVAHIRDITDKKQAQKAIAQSEEKYRNLFEKSPAGIFKATIEGQIIECNNEYLKVLGYDSIENIKKISTKSLYADPKDREKLVELLRKQKEVKDYVMKLKKKDGSYVWVYDSVSLMYDEDLKKEVLFGTMVDITAQKEAEKEIWMLAHSLESISECVSITDANNIILYVNDSFVKTYGYKKEELVGQHISIVQPSSLVSPEIQSEILWQTEVGGWKGELINKRRDGSEFPVFLSTSIVKDSENKQIALIGVSTDITERKRAEEALRLSEEKFNKAFQSSPIAMSLQNNENLFVDVNNAFLKLTEFSSEEIIGRRGKDLQLWADVTESKRANECFIANGVIRDFEFMFRKKTGEIGIGIMSAESIALDGKKASLTAVLDITERKLAEEEIRRLNRIYTVLSNINQTIVREKDKNQLLNKACKIAIDDGKFKMSWIGLIDEQSGELKAEGSHGFVDGFLEEVILNKKNYPNGIKPISELIAAGKALIFNDIEKLDTNVFWRQPALNRGYKSSAVFPLKVFGKIIGNYSLFSDHIDFFEKNELRLLEEMSEDISFALETMEIEKKRKESELLFYTLADNSPVGIFRTRADGYTTYVNPKWCQLAGMKAEEALGDGWLRAVHPEDQIWLAKGWKSATDKKQSSVTEYRFIRSDGKIAWVMGQAIPELNSEGQIKGYVGTITDITNIKLYEHGLIKAKETAESSERIKSEFLAQMSHEIRTPINVIVSSTSYLKEELEDKIEHELFSIFNSVDRASKRIIRTMDLILNMAEIQTNSYHSSQVELNLSGKFLTNIYNEFITDAKEKNLEFNLHCKTADANIYADEYSVKKIFVHLIDNAIKYTPEGKVDLTVDKDAEGKIFVSIADTGIGMSNEFMAMMYNPFTQEEQGYSRSFEGNGLGLALAKKYCEINNATVTVESAKGKGTIFTVKF